MVEDTRRARVSVSNGVEDTSVEDTLYGMKDTSSSFSSSEEE